jgi:hypothetical protein
MINRFRYVQWAAIVAIVVVGCMAVAAYNVAFPKKEEV